VTSTISLKDSVGDLLTDLLTKQQRNCENIEFGLLEQCTA
jgi:hypothetical protein